MSDKCRKRSHVSLLTRPVVKSEELSGVIAAQR